MNHAAHHHREKGRGTHPSDYLPVVVILVLTLAAALAWQGPFLFSIRGTPWMPDFMGLFLVVFAMFKFFDLPGFADGFQMYDLLASRFRPYAFAYPFIEALLGLGFLSRWNPAVVSGVALVVTLFGACGVLNALRKGLDLECACMG
ncbi:MAG TPA: MauE/DoxX family redox-associated membrane protein, partial [Candidatus Methylacidiphilales bacterium]